MPDAKLLVRDVTVVDPRDGSSRAHHDVLVADGRILGVLPTEADRRAPEEVDGRGRYLVPGFNDMHAHPLSDAAPQGSLSLMLAHGITGFRQMSGSPALLKRAPLPVESPALLGLPGEVLSPANANTPSMAVASARAQHAAGADFIKVGMLTRDALYAVQSECGRLGINVLGHLPPGVDVERASGDGFRSIEHLGPGVSVLACCSSDRERLLQAIRARRELKVPAPLVPLLRLVGDRALKRLVINPVNVMRPADLEALNRAVSTFDEDSATKLAERFVADQTWHVPTLIRSVTTMRANDPSYPKDPNIRFIRPAAVASWQKATKKFAAFPAEAHEVFRTTTETMRRLAKLLDDAGVLMLTGSDSGGAAWVVPGAALHQEFDQLAQAGFTPLRVLQMATCDPAAFLGRTDRAGVIEEGKQADLVLLEADPLQSVEHLHRIVGVIRAGRHYSSDDLAAITARISTEPSAA